MMLGGVLLHHPFFSSSNGKLTNINLPMLASIEPFKNLTFQSGFSYRTLEAASDAFSLDYYTDAARTITKVM
jgi:hypothetical protein